MTTVLDERHYDIGKQFRSGRKYQCEMYHVKAQRSLIRWLGASSEFFRGARVYGFSIEFDWWRLSRCVTITTRFDLISLA